MTKRLLALTLLALVGWLIYHPGLKGGFVFDDNPNIVHNTKLNLVEKGEISVLEALDAGDSGPLKRPIAMLTFAMNVSAAGFDPYYFKSVNLAIHVVNSILIFFLVLALLRSAAWNGKHQSIVSNEEFVAMLVALLWLVHPINVTSVLYVVQRMTSLSALFVISGLLAYIHIRLHEFESKKSYSALKVCVIAVFTISAALCKENGLLLPVYALLAEWLLFEHNKFKQYNKYYAITSVVVISAIFAVSAIYAIHYFGLLDGYNYRSFNLQERLLTQSRVIWFYIYIFLLPNEYNINLYYDGFSISESLLEPVSTLYSLVALIFVCLAWFNYYYQYRLACLGVGLFFAGHLMESTIFPLEMVFLHRNYFPSFGLALSVVVVLCYVVPVRLRLFTSAALILLIVFHALSTHAIAKIWSNPLLLSQSEVLNNPTSSRANYEIARTLVFIYDYIDQDDSILSMAFDYLEKASGLNQSTTQPLLTLIMIASQQQQPIRTYWITELKRRAGNEIFVSGEPSALRLLLQCHVRSRCDIPDEVIHEIIEAYRLNPDQDSKLAEYISSIIDNYESLEKERGEEKGPE